jgi:hypothetical protein
MKNTGKLINTPRFDSEGYQVGINELNGAPLPNLAALETRPLHGGARIGSGRKPNGNVRITLRLKPDTVKRLHVVAARRKATLSSVAETMLARVK